MYIKNNYIDCRGCLIGVWPNQSSLSAIAVDACIHFPEIHSLDKKPQTLYCISNSPCLRDVIEQTIFFKLL